MIENLKIDKDFLKDRYKYIENRKCDFCKKRLAHCELLTVIPFFKKGQYQTKRLCPRCFILPNKNAKT